jgi:arginyl-tRNA synthetase
MLARAGRERVDQALGVAPVDGRDGGEEPLHESERALVALLLGFPGEFAEAVARRAPHRIAAHALELAQGFTAFYRDCKVLGAEPEALESWRLALSVASMAAIGRSLDLLGVSAPERM